MADIVCSYQLENKASSSGYLVFASHLSFSDLQNHFCTVFALPRCVLLSKNLQEITSSQALRSLITDGCVELIIRDPSIPGNIPTVETITNINSSIAQPEQEANPSQIPAKIVLGNSVKMVLAHHGVGVKPEYDSIEDLVSSIPFGKCLCKKLCRMRNHPAWFESKIQRIAKKANVDPDAFRAEITVLADQVEASRQMRKFSCTNCERVIDDVRYQCLECWKYVLCSACEALNHQEPFHAQEHVFAKLNRADQKLRNHRKFRHHPRFFNPPRDKPSDEDEEDFQGHPFHKRFVHPFTRHGHPGPHLFHHGRPHHFPGPHQGHFPHHAGPHQGHFPHHGRPHHFPGPHHAGPHQFHGQPHHQPRMPPHCQAANENRRGANIPDSVPSFGDEFPHFGRVGHMKTRVEELEKVVADLKLSLQKDN